MNQRPQGYEPRASWLKLPVATDRNIVRFRIEPSSRIRSIAWKSSNFFGFWKCDLLLSSKAGEFIRGRAGRIVRAAEGWKRIRVTSAVEAGGI